MNEIVSLEEWALYMISRSWKPAERSLPMVIAGSAGGCAAPAGAAQEGLESGGSYDVQPDMAVGHDQSVGGSQRPCYRDHQTRRSPR
jgi:hypothetical protein